MAINVKSKNATNVRFLKVPLAGSFSTFVYDKKHSITSVPRVIFSSFKLSMSSMTIMFDTFINTPCRMRDAIPLRHANRFEGKPQKFSTTPFFNNPSVASFFFFFQP